MFGLPWRRLAMDESLWLYEVSATPRRHRAAQAARATLPLWGRWRFDIRLVTMICDFQQIQEGQQIPLFLHLLASLNLLEMNSDFTKPDGSGYSVGL